MTGDCDRMQQDEPAADDSGVAPTSLAETGKTAPRLVARGSAALVEAVLPSKAAAALYRLVKTSVALRPMA